MESVQNTSVPNHEDAASNNNNINTNTNNTTANSDNNENKDDQNVGNAMVSFYTSTYHKHMPEQVYSIPLNILPDGLNNLVNSVLSSMSDENEEEDEDKEEITFDFLYKDEYITSSLLRFLQRRKINYEDVLHIEYTPSLEIKEGVLLPHDDWISCVRAPFVNNASILLTANYDRCIRLWKDEVCVAIGAFHTGAVKEICVRDYCPDASSSYSKQKINVRSNNKSNKNNNKSEDLEEADNATTTKKNNTQTRRKRLRHNDHDNNKDINNNESLVDFECVSGSKDGSLAAWHYHAQQHRFELLGYVNAHVDGIDGVHCTSGPFASSSSSSSSSSFSSSSSSFSVNNEWNTLVASASWDSTVKIYTWDQLVESDQLPSTKAPLIHFTDHTRPVLSCRFNHQCCNNNNKFTGALSSLHLYSAGLDGNVKSLRVDSTSLQSQWTCGHPINKLAIKPISNETDLILCACTDNRARLIDSRSKDVVKVYSGHRQELYSCTWLDDETFSGNSSSNNTSSGSLLATCSEDATIKVYDLRCATLPLLDIDHLHTDGVLDVTCCGQSIMASGGKDNKLKTFSVAKQSGAF